jgi:hypothetical protein
MKSLAKSQSLENSVKAFINNLSRKGVKLSRLPSGVLNIEEYRLLTPRDKQRLDTKLDDERVMFYMAGFLAEAHYSPTEVDVKGSMYDFGKALSLVEGYESLLQKHFEVTLAMLWDNWSEVIVIAYALLERQRLTGDELAKVVGRCCSRMHL